MSTPMTEFWGTCLGFEQLTSLSAATALTVPAGSHTAVMTCETQNVRYRDDGTNPSSTVGIVLVKDLTPFVFKGNLAQLKFIETAASAKLNVTYYGKRPSVN